MVGNAVLTAVRPVASYVHGDLKCDLVSDAMLRI